MRALYTLLLFWIGFTVYGQQLTVMDSQTGEPIPNVLLYNKSKSVYNISNVNGRVPLDRFGLDEKIFIHSIAHKDLIFTKQQLIDLQLVLTMTPRSESMNPVVLSASKFRQRQQDVPQKIVTITSKDVYNGMPQTSADLLQQSDKIFIQKSQQGGGSPMIRGFSTNRLLINVDGVRMNSAIFRGGNVQNVISIDPLSIQRSEVILGPGSVVYGSDAIGGVMNFYTINPGYSKDSVQMKGGFLARYATANRENTAHLNMQYSGKRWASATSISLNFYDDLRMGSNGPDDYLRERYVISDSDEDVVVANPNPLIQRPTGYDQTNLFQKFRYKASEKLDLSLGFIYTATSDYDRYDALNRFRESGMPRQAQWYYGPQKWLLTYLKATHQGNGKWYDQLVLTQAYQKFNESRNVRDFQDDELFINDEEVHAHSTNIDFKRRNGAGNTLFYGAEFIHNRVYSEGTRFDINTRDTTTAASRYPDGASWRSLAAYVNYQKKWSKKWSSTMGLRYSHVWIDATFDQRIFDLPFVRSKNNTGALTGAVGLVYKTDKDWVWRLHGNTAFRAPNVDDVGKVFDPNPGTVMVPNPDLEAEYAYNAEVGFTKQWSEGLQIEVAAFYTFLKDALVARDFELNGQAFIDYQGDLSRVQAVQNAEQANVYGFDWGLTYRWNDKWGLKQNLTYTHGVQQDETGDQFALRHVAPLFGALHVVYNNGPWSMDAFINYNGERTFENLAPSQQARPHLYASDENGNPYAPAWYTLNCRASFAINKQLKLVGILENLTDQRYRTYSSGVAAPGRNLIMSLLYNF